MFMGQSVGFGLRIGKIPNYLTEGKEIDGTSPSCNYIKQIFRLFMTFSKARNECIVSRECKYKTLDIPAEEFNDFKNAMIKVGEAESVQLALQDGEEEPEVIPTSKAKKGKK